MIPQTPWVERRFNFAFPAGMFPVILSRLEGTIFRLEGSLKQLPETECSKPMEGWTIKEHIGHLTDLEELWWKRLQDFKNNRPVLTAADMSNAKTRMAGHQYNSYSTLLDAFALERRKLIAACSSLDKISLLKTAQHPRLNTPIRLIDSLYFVAEHDDHHLAKIGSLMRGAKG